MNDMTNVQESTKAGNNRTNTASQTTESKNIFVSSARELKVLQNVILCGLMGALAIILGNLSLKITDHYRIGFAWIPNRLVDYLFGPVTGAIFGGVMDNLKFFISGDSGYNPIYMIPPILAGFVCGTILYKKPVSIFRVIAAQLFLKIVVNSVVTTLIMTFTGGKALDIIFVPRLIKNLIMLPVDTVILFVTLRTIAEILPKIRRNSGN